MQVINKQDICIAEEYESNGEQRKFWHKVGEIVTFQGNDGPFQRVKMWGPGGIQQMSVFDKRDRNAPQQAPQQRQQAPQQRPPQQQYAPQPQQQYDDSDIPWGQ